MTSQLQIKEQMFEVNAKFDVERAKFELER